MGLMKNSSTYLDPKILGRLAKLDVKARMFVEGLLSGLHRSPFHGNAVEFAEHREYVPGDEIRHIDWKLWGRAERYYIKQYEEETNLSATIAVDCSRSMAYGTQTNGVPKYAVAATLAACLAHLLLRQQDASGLCLFAENIVDQVPPRSHPRHIQTLTDLLAGAEPQGAAPTDEVFIKLAQMQRRRGLVVVITDALYDSDILLSGLQRLRHQRQDVVLFHLLHEDEVTFSFRENLRFDDLEGPDELVAQPEALRQSYLQALENAKQTIRSGCARLQVDYNFLHTGDPLDAALNAFLHRRQRRGSL